MKASFLPGIPSFTRHPTYHTSFTFLLLLSSVQFSRSVVSDFLRMNRSTPGLPVHHCLPEFTQTHVHRVSDAIQPSHPLLSPSLPALNPSQHQSFPMSQLFAWGGQSTGVSVAPSTYLSYNQIYFVILIIPAPYRTNLGVLPEEYLKNHVNGIL